VSQIFSDPLPQMRGTLGRKVLIFEWDPPAFAGIEAYRFKYVILSDVAYESVLNRLRPALHAAVAHWLPRHSGEQANMPG
jgi:hypothetical protein